MTKSTGTQLSEAASICLDDCQHISPTKMAIYDGANSTTDVIWTAPTVQMKRTYNHHEATELGACGIAALLMRDMQQLHIVERASQGTGSDYWLLPLDKSGVSQSAGIFEGRIRLEVSGIRNGTPATITQRLKQKVQQLKKPGVNTSAFAVVVEFGSPQAQIKKLP